jgi:hypothetical protein
MNIWEVTILRIVLSLGGTVDLQQIYRSLENGKFMRLTEHDLRETQWHSRPAYQHQVRSHISNLAQAGDLAKISRGVYSITEKGRQRIIA